MAREFTYGPFKSRRLGLSLGVDILPRSKICTYNCVYCEIGTTHPTNLVSPQFKITEPSNIKHFEKELTRLFKYIKKLDSITFGYNGEPTLNSHLEDFYKVAKDVRKKTNWKEDPPKLTLFTNSSTLYEKEIRDIVKNFELVLGKLDIATQEDFLRTNRPHPNVPPIDTIINSLTKLKSELPKNHCLGIQCLLYQSYKEDFLSNNNEQNIENLSNAINNIRPDFVQLYSIARIPAEYYIYSLDHQNLLKIKQKIEKTLSNSVKIYCY
jgi:wyosine [tRNA(Phe)-imidazoG37] synthetase (radical SAM superfamily)